jgi:60 kDa SS-A/Ro ribonucleoprotein
MSKFNQKTAGAPKTTNIAGGVAFSLSTKQELVHAVLTSFLKDEFYESGSDRADRIVGLAQSVAKNDPSFLAKLAVYARQEFNLRSVSHLLLGELAKGHKGDSLTKDAIVAASPRPDDLAEIVAYVGSPIPKQVKRGVRNAILKYTPFQLSKYKMEGKKVSLVDLFNVSHPKAQHATIAQQAAWAKLLRGELKLEGAWESDVSGADGQEEKTAAWESLVISKKIGYFALLRNLNNLIKSAVSFAAIDSACEMLVDKERILKSRVLPFRFLTAYQNVRGNRRLIDALMTAADIAVENVPVFDGAILIAVDQSGSMHPYADKAGMLAAALMKNNKTSDCVAYGTEIRDLEIHSNTPVLETAQNMKGDMGGTDTGLVFKKAQAENKKYDTIIILSDNEAWESDTQSAYNAYKLATGANPQIFAIDIAGYGTVDLKSEKVLHIAGFSEKIFDLMKVCKNSGDLVSTIESYKY